MRLAILLGDIDVARLVRRDDGTVELTFLADYRVSYPRPVLGLHYLDKLTRPLPFTSGLPSFFTNLLPEADGPLRRLIVHAAGIREHQELRLLAHLGEDLPGAVIVRPLDSFEDHEAPSPELGTTPPPATGNKLRFSLAGVQLKYSMVRHGKGLTLPASGRGGDWIVKLPDAEYERVPENEYAVMSWARESGIEVPEFDLVPHADLVGLPDRRIVRDELCFAIRRFDRLPGDRVHIEDFAQVNGVHPFRKYDDERPVAARLNFETLANQILTFCGEADLRQFILRLVFTVLSGNADAHLKNWSLIYPDGRTPRLSPAYDQVATIAYIPSDELALPFANSLSFETATVDAFRRLARKLRRDPDEMERWVTEDVERIMDAWTTHAAGLPLPLEARFALDQHHKRLRATGTLLK
ncbi:type II toxin-antitoxin system HipA family toxin [Nannocystis bainbridge]|uniref:Type II toxin-antitoxin system HipA family toxin n=1 Tax=Nannocystis bainbridge TaxID=2995303 RepID=A0ABT5E5I2_9BACT|nr:type II toxin-antitoxin system HipA family toxin [Nannocystis bainbridge]MDC0720703.1 type II toxin-antitoxin system HipA family toxin [Nannocystis bainbridge]